ncbi:unnamed protein product, partial [Brenthis ino]
MPPHLNFGAFVLQKILAHDSDKAALINGSTGEEISYKEMAQKIVNVATSLLNLGIKKGDTVAVFSENRIEYILTAIAVYCSGATVTFFNSAYTKDDLINALTISKATYIFLSSETFTTHEYIKSIKTIIKCILYDDVSNHTNCLYFKNLAENYADIKTYQAYDFKGTTQTSTILYSSGTTGLAKGAKISHQNLITVCQQPMMTTTKLKPLTIAPWSSTFGLTCTLREIAYGRTLVFLQKYNEKQYLRTIEKYKIDMLYVAPPLIVMLYKSMIASDYNLSTIEIIYSGGALVHAKSIRKLKDRFPHIKHVLQGYGMTEATGAVTEELEDAAKEGSVGRVVPGIIAKIVDPETNKILGCNEPGEVCIKGPVLFEGYIGRDMKNEFDNDGFYKTGDIAYYDEDGYFYIVDRIKEIIKYKAWQVSPSELEAIILQHPAVKDVGVTGAPDTLAGQLPTAFVVKQPNANVTEQEIIDFVSDKVSPWKKLRGGVIFLKEIPKTASGKILRRKLQTLLPKQIPQKLPASKL